MNLRPANSLPTIVREMNTLDDQIGVCYHCRQTVWDGQSARWQAPSACPHCQHPLTLVLQAHQRRSEASA